MKAVGPQGQVSASLSLRCRCSHYTRLDRFLYSSTSLLVALCSCATAALYRLEVTLTAETGKLRTPAGMEHGLKESLNRAWSYIKIVQDRLGLASMLTQKDLAAEAIDLSGGRVECACGVAFLVAMFSAIGQRRMQAGTLILGDLTIQGNIKVLPSITHGLRNEF